MATNIPYGSQQAVVVQSAGLFAANMQRNTTLNRLTGKMPQQADAEGTIRKQVVAPSLTPDSYTRHHCPG